MIGFRAQALDDEISVDGDELEEARWFTRDDMAAAGAGQRHDSIEHYLIEDWLRAGGQPGDQPVSASGSARR